MDLQVGKSYEKAHFTFKTTGWTNQFWVVVSTLLRDPCTRSGDFCHATQCNFCRALSCNFKIEHTVNHLPRFCRHDIAEVANMFETWCNSEHDKNCIKLCNKNCLCKWCLRRVGICFSFHKPWTNPIWKDKHYNSVQCKPPHPSLIKDCYVGLSLIIKGYWWNEGWVIWKEKSSHNGYEWRFVVCVLCVTGLGHTILDNFSTDWLVIK